MVPTNFRPNGDSTMAAWGGLAVTVPVVVHLAPSGDRDRRNLCTTKSALLLRNGCLGGTIMMRRAVALVMSCAALSGCGALPSMPFSLPSSDMPSFSVRGTPAGTPVHVTSVPPGAKASLGRDDQSCTTPCTLIATNGTGTYTVSFKLNGYQPQSVPVRIAVNESSSMQTGDAGSAPTTVITPDPVMAELAAMKPPAARTKVKPGMKIAATPAPPPASSPPPPAPPTMPTPVGTTLAGRP